MGSVEYGQATELGLELLATGQDIQLTVGGESMYPSILPGEKVVVSKTKFSEVEVGDVVVFKRNDGWVAHRVLDRSAEALITKGDSLISKDSPVSEDEFVGTVIKVIQGEKQIDLSSPSERSSAKTRAKNSGVLKYFFHLGNKISRRFR